jgi:hypothetical protein
MYNNDKVKRHASVFSLLLFRMEFQGKISFADKRCLVPLALRVFLMFYIILILVLGKNDPFIIISSL